MRHRILGLLVLSLLLSFSLFAQNVRESVTIEVVDVPVFVIRGAQPVEGLTRDHFELYVNGKPQPIDYFDVADSGQRAEDAAAPRTLRERRLFLLMFDVAFSDPHAIGRAQRAAAELVAHAPPSDLFAIATFSSRRDVWFATPFTADRIALARAVASLSASSSGDPLSIVLTRSERQMLDEWATEAPERGDFFFFHDPVLNQISGEALRDVRRMPLQRVIEDQILDFTDLAARLATLQGQKHVVVLSEGSDYAPRPQRSADVRRVSFAVNDEMGIPSTPTVDMMAGRISRSLEEMHKAFHGADILLHTLDLKGVSTLLGTESLYVLARGTGGRAVHNRNDFGNALIALSNSYSHGYVLGFKPSGAKRGYNRIEVKVKELPRGTTVRYRKGFSGTARPFDANEGLYLADVILNDVPQSGTAAALELRDGALEVKVPLRPLSAQLGKEGTAELLVYVFDAAGEPLEFHCGGTSIRKDVSPVASAGTSITRRRPAWPRRCFG